MNSVGASKGYIDKNYVNKNNMTTKPVLVGMPLSATENGTFGVTIGDTEVPYIAALTYELDISGNGTISRVGAAVTIDKVPDTPDENQYHNVKIRAKLDGLNFSEWATYQFKALEDTIDGTSVVYENNALGDFEAQGNNIYISNVVDTETDFIKVKPHLTLTALDALTIQAGSTATNLKTSSGATGQKFLMSIDGINLISGVLGINSPVGGGNTEFETVLYTGNGATQTIPMANINGGVDFVWIKDRTLAQDHHIYDTIRGVDQKIQTNSTIAESDNPNSLTAFGASSFDLGNPSNTSTNKSGSNFVAWCASLPIDTPTNTNGTITSHAKVATSGFMSAISYTGTAANATVGHGLSAAPELIICKARAAVDSGGVYEVTNGATNYMYLDTTAASAAAATLWNNTEPTANVFSLGSNTVGNATGGMIAYAFTSVAGKCKVGSYTGTGSGVDNAITTGFETHWVMIKRTDLASSWIILDSARGVDEALYADSSSIGVVDAGRNTLDADGFTVGKVSDHENALGGTYIYLAIAKNTVINNFDISGFNLGATPTQALKDIYEIQSKIGADGYETHTPKTILGNTLTYSQIDKISNLLQSKLVTSNFANISKLELEL